LSSNDCLNDKNQNPAMLFGTAFARADCPRSYAQGLDVAMRTEFHRLFAPGFGSPLILALTVCAMPSVTEAKQSVAEARATRVTVLCTKSSEHVVSGLTKICYFNCGKSERALKVTTYEACPHRALRWQLNHDAAMVRACLHDRALKRSGNGPA
jgi:hypothetical protein